MKMKIKFFACLILSGLLVTNSFGSDEKDKRSMTNKFSLSSYSSSLNKGASTDNVKMSVVSVSLKGTRSSSRDVGLSFLKTTKSIGGEMEIFLTDRFSLALGAEFRSNSPSDVRLSAGEISTHFSNGNSAFETNASLIPILGTIRFNVPFQKFRAYFGAGAGLYLGKLRISWQSPNFADERFYAKGMAIIPHLNGGLSYKLSKRISVGFDVRYVMGRFNSLTIKESADLTLVGQKLSLTEINTYGNQFPWELKGLNLGFMVRLNF